MKIVAIILLFLFAFNIVFAQHEIDKATFPKITLPPSKAITGAGSFKNPNTLRGGNSNWVNYANDYAHFYAAGPYFSYSLVLFPDTGIILTLYNDTLYYPQLHGAAVMYDPYTTVNPWLNQNASYTVDSVAVDFAYTRNLPANIVDTLALTMLKGTGNSNDNITITASGGKTIFVCPAVKYDYQTNSADTASAYSTQKIPLTEADSSIHFKLVSYAVTGIPTLNPRSLIGAAVSFIPGYTYTLQDSLSQKDIFYLLSSEENGVGTNMNWIYNDLNSSYIIPSFTLYNNDPGWNGLYFPSFAEDYSDAAWPYENHIIWFHLVLSVGTNAPDLLITNGLDFYPNPTSDMANFSYTLNQNAKQVAFKITDVTGREMLNQNIGQQTNGSHQTSFSIKNFATGVYFYSFSVDNKLYTGKFIVE